MTKKKFDSLSELEQQEKLLDIYNSNISMFAKAIQYCAINNIGMYRVTSNLFSMLDLLPNKKEVLNSFVEPLQEVKRIADIHNIRITIHPDQWVVLSSENPDVVMRSIAELSTHATVFDLIGLERSRYNLINIHGGKGNRIDALVEVINTLHPSIKSRLTLENDENTYGVEDLLEVSRATGVPVLFDAHHHLCYEQLSSYNATSVRKNMELCRESWGTESEYFTTHISNGTTYLLNHRHSDYIEHFPLALHDVPYVEVEARAKELAIFKLKEQYPELR
jgi:UV DNA damage endonuclease